MDLGFTDVWGGEPTDARLAEGRGGLRPLGWSELCARLAAAQDLRRDMNRQAQASLPYDAPPESPGTHMGRQRFAGSDGKGWQASAEAASFHRPAAQMLLDVAFPPFEPEGERGVNPPRSGIGKAVGGTPLPDKVPGQDPHRPSFPECPSRREKP